MEIDDADYSEDQGSLREVEGDDGLPMSLKSWMARVTGDGERGKSSSFTRSKITDLHPQMISPYRTEVGQRLLSRAQRKEP